MNSNEGALGLDTALNEAQECLNRNALYEPAASEEIALRCIRVAQLPQYSPIEGSPPAGTSLRFF